MYTRRDRVKRSGDTKQKKKNRLPPPLEKSDKISLYIQNVMQEYNFQLEFIKTDAHLGGGYKQFVRFTTGKTPGFVVQQVVKDLKVTPGPGVKVLTFWNYWEIFYVNKKGKSIEADGFVQKSCDATSSGKGRQTGTAYFYPYDGKVDYDGTSLPWAKDLQDIFGEHVHFSSANLNAALKLKEQDLKNAKEANNRNVIKEINAQIRVLHGKIKAGGSISEAGGLPSSEDRPTMTGLKCIPHAIEHITHYDWPKFGTTYVDSTLCYVCSQCRDTIRCLTHFPQAMRSH